jgi:hypothetical protein
MNPLPIITCIKRAVYYGYMSIVTANMLIDAILIVINGDNAKN